MIDIKSSVCSIYRPRVAVLIDIENTSHRLADRIFHEAEILGEVVVRRGYADFSNKSLKWADTINRHFIHSVHRFASSKGKNSSDMALAIDAMDLLYEGFGGRIDVFCLITSDGDFGQVACKMRAKGREVIGMGTMPAASFRSSCTRYISIADAVASDGACVKRPVDEEIIAIFHDALGRAQAENGWATLADVGNNILKLRTDFKPNEHGFKKLMDMAKAMPGFEIEKSVDGVIRIRSVAATSSEDVQLHDEKADNVVLFR